MSCRWTSPDLFFAGANETNYSKLRSSVRPTGPISGSVLAGSKADQDGPSDQMPPRTAGPTPEHKLGQYRHPTEYSLLSFRIQATLLRVHGSKLRD